MPARRDPSPRGSRGAPGCPRPSSDGRYCFRRGSRSRTPRASRRSRRRAAGPERPPRAASRTGRGLRGAASRTPSGRRARARRPRAPGNAGGLTPASHSEANCGNSRPSCSANSGVEAYSSRLRQKSGPSSFFSSSMARTAVRERDRRIEGDFFRELPSEHLLVGRGPGQVEDLAPSDEGISSGLRWQPMHHSIWRDGNCAVRCILSMRPWHVTYPTPFATWMLVVEVHEVGAGRRPSSSSAACRSGSSRGRARASGCRSR